MKRTKLRIASLAAGAALLIGGVTSSPATAEKRRVIVTLQGGKVVTLTVDAAPGMPVTAGQLPDLGAPVVSVVEAPAATTPTTPATAPQTTTAPPTTAQPTTPARTGTAGRTGTTPSTTGTTGRTGTTRTGTTPSTTGTTGTVTTPGATGTGTTGTGTGTTGTGTTGTTGTGTTGTTRTGGRRRTPRQPPAVGGIVTPKGQAKGEGGRAVRTGRRGRRDDEAALIDANRDGTATPNETPDTPPQAEGAQPTPDTPGFTVAPSLQTPAGVPNFFIEQFRVPPFLLPIYQAAGTQYGVPWQILAAINEIETDYGRNLSVSSAGALGWMQFMPSSWEAYGVDANGDGVKDPYNPVDAIFAAARYLKAANIDEDLEGAIFAYNHADWYVQSVLLRARVIGGMPADIVGSLTGITQGRFPVAARATYADSLDARSATRRVRSANAAVPVEGDPDRRSINIYAARGAPVVAVNDGRIVKVGHSSELGRYVVLQDVYGNRYTYSHLASVARKHPVPKPRSKAELEASGDLELPARDRAPTKPASDGQRSAAQGDGDADRRGASRSAGADRRDRADAARGGRRRGSDGDAPAKERIAANGGDGALDASEVSKERLFANPSRPAAYAAGGQRQMEAMGERLTTFEGYFTGALDLDPDDYVLKPLRRGSTVVAGTVLGRIGKTRARLAPHVEFTIRPAGRGAPRIDPKPILDGWKLLESTAVYKADNENVFARRGAGPSIGQILLMTKQELQARVLANPNIEIYQCGRDDITAGLIDRRVLATLEYLAASGLKPTISSLQCGHGLMTSSGNVSEHSVGSAMDIAAVNGITITPATQGEGSITDMTIRRLLQLQGTMKPHQIISLMTYPGTDNTLAMPDHDDHIHVGFHAVEQPGDTPRLQTLMRPEQWTRLVEQLGTIQNPVVPTRPSRYALRARDGE